MSIERFLAGLAQLETAGGTKTIKGPNGEDSHNLFNIKDFSGKGFRAFDKMEKSNDAYRVFASREEATKEVLGLLERRYPRALTAKNSREFAEALKAGGYATDPNYVEKLTAVIDGLGEDASIGTIAAPEPKVPTLPDMAVPGAFEPERIAAAQDARLADEDRRSKITFGDTFGVARRDADVMLTFQIADALVREKEERPAGWDWMATRAEVIKDRTLEEIEELDENAHGPQTVQRIVAEQNARRDIATKYADAGAFQTFAAQMAAGMTDPGAAVATFATAGLFRLGKVGSGAYVAAGRGRAAAVSAVAESAAAELALTAAADMANGRQTVEDYAIATAASALFGSLPAISAYRGAAEQANLNLAQDMIDRAIREKMDKPADVRRQEAEQVTKDLTGDNVSVKKVMPDDLREEIEAEYEGQPKKAQVEAGQALKDEAAMKRAQVEAKAEEPGAQAPEPPMSARDKLVKLVAEAAERHKAGDYTRTMSELAALVDTPDWDSNLLGGNDLLAKRARQVLAEADHRMLGAGSNQPGPTRVGTILGQPIMAELGKSTRMDAVRDMLRQGDGPQEGYNVRKASMREVLSALSRQKRSTPHAKLAALILDRLNARGDKILDDLPVIFKRAPDTADVRTAPRGKSDPRGAVLVGMTQDPARNPNPRSVADMRLASLDELLNDSTTWALDTTLHELIHAVTQLHTHSYKDLGMRSELSLEVRAAIEGLQSVLDRLRARVGGQYEGSTKPWDGKTVLTQGPNYAAKNIDELLAMALSDRDTQLVLANMPASPGFGGRYSNALREVYQAILTMLGMILKPRKERTALDEVMHAFEIILDRRLGGVMNVQTGQYMGWRGDTLAISNGPTALEAVNPIATVNPARKFAQRMMDHARDWVRDNPIDQDKVKVLTDKIGSRSDGIILARSKHPVMQMVAGMVTEVTTGAAGRRATVAIRKHMLEKKLTGRGIQDYRAALDNWLRTQNKGVVSEAVTGDGQREFDRLVYEEILARRETKQPASQDPSVRAAADSLEQVFTRALDAQKQASVLGAQRLPPDSIGYIPQALDGRKLALASIEQMRELESHLAKHWATALGWDPDFARDFARFYTTRARERAMNTKGVDTAGGENAASVVRDTLEVMKEIRINDPAGLVAVQRAEAILSKAGQGHTKHRLDVDLLAELPSGKRVIDFYETDSLNMMRRYVGRTSGTVALTEFGIHGATGVRHLRRAISEAGDPAERATQEELDAFDRVMGEVLNGHIEGEKSVRWASNLATLVRVQRLGSLVFTQFAETMNMVHHLGLTTTLKGIASLPQIMGEVGRVKKGAPRKRHILTDIELWGGDIGMENYQLRIPVEAPDDRLAEYAKDAGVATRVLSGLQHVQGKITGFRRLMAAQHRMVAEQIVMKAARYVKEGKNDIYLQDMGLNEELIGHLRTNLQRVASWDASGRLTRFDITALPNPAAAEEFVQLVHRGTAQIIQGTFIGERTAWMHNDYMKVLAQLRTFGITAMEKQWSRTARINGGGAAGYGTAAMILVAQMALILPIHLARVHAASVGREDQQEYIEKNLAPVALVRATANYASMSGLLGDFLEVVSGAATGWSGDQDLMGGRMPSQLTVAGVVPALGSIDAASKLFLQGQALENPYWALKQLPGANIPYVIPFLNLLKE
jgi:hypothetical protein